MLLDDMLDLLTSQGLGSVSTTSGNGTLYGGNLPDDPDEAMCVYETGGLGTVKTMGTKGPEQPAVEVLSRAPDYAVARANAQKAWLLLDGVRTSAGATPTWPRTINGTSYQWAAARQSPFMVGRDAQQRFLISFNLDLVKGISTTS